MSSPASHPRINCLVPGCKRGTTRIAPYQDGTSPEVICGKHWRTVPKAWRLAMSRYRRAFAAAERKGDERRQQVARRCWWSGWDRIVRTLCNPETVMAGELPATVAEELRRDGLL